MVGILSLQIAIDHAEQWVVTTNEKPRIFYEVTSAFTGTLARSNES